MHLQWSHGEGMAVRRGCRDGDGGGTVGVRDEGKGIRIRAGVPSFRVFSRNEIFIRTTYLTGVSQFRAFFRWFERRT